MYSINFLKGRIIKKKKKIVLVFVKKKILLKKYNKKIYYFSKLWAYDIFGESNIGDYVLIRKSRPLTKMLFWILSKVLEKVRII